MGRAWHGLGGTRKLVHIRCGCGIGWVGGWIWRTGEWVINSISIWLKFYMNI